MKTRTFLMGLLKAAGLVAVWEWLEEILEIDRGQSQVVGEGDLKGPRKRYSIGHNPRVRTLQKVSRHCMRLLKRHEKYIREFFPKKTVRYGIPPREMLSTAEKKLLRQ